VKETLREPSKEPRNALSVSNLHGKWLFAVGTRCHAI
jgi:hypothetical protein